MRGSQFQESSAMESIRQNILYQKHRDVIKKIRHTNRFLSPQEQVERLEMLQMHSQQVHNRASAKLEEDNIRIVRKLLLIKKGQNTSVAKADNWRIRDARKSPLYSCRGHKNFKAENSQLNSENQKLLQILQNTKSSSGVRIEKIRDESRKQQYLKDMIESSRYMNASIPQPGQSKQQKKIPSNQNSQSPTRSPSLNAFGKSNRSAELVLQGSPQSSVYEIDDSEPDQTRPDDMVITNSRDKLASPINSAALSRNRPQFKAYNSQLKSVDVKKTKQRVFPSEEQEIIQNQTERQIIERIQSIEHMRKNFQQKEQNRLCLPPLVPSDQLRLHPEVMKSKREDMIVDYFIVQNGSNRKMGQFYSYKMKKPLKRNSFHQKQYEQFNQYQDSEITDMDIDQ